MKLIVVSLSHLFSILNSILLRFIYKLCIRSFIKLDTDSYSIHSTLTSSRKLEEDIVIEGASQESVSSKYHHSLVLAGDWTTILNENIICLSQCAKFCSEAKVTCVGFQYNLQTSKCRLLEPGFIKKSDKPSLRSFWVTFQNKKQDGSTLTKLPIISSGKKKKEFNTHTQYMFRMTNVYICLNTLTHIR